MSYTLVEAAKLSNDVLQAGVIEKFIKDDPILERIPWIEILGNGLTYNVEKTEATAQFYNVGDVWVEGTGEVEQATAFLKILGGDADVDNFLKATRSNINDLTAEAIENKIKAVKKAFMDAFYYGYNTGDPKEFDGLHNLINSATYNTVPVGAAANTPTLLSMMQLEETIDKIKGVSPELMVMTKNMRRRINKYLRGAGGITYGDFANKRVQEIFGVPVGVSEYLSDAENVDKDFVDPAFHGFEPTTPDAASDGATTIFVLNFGPKACCGVHIEPMTTVKLGDLETKDASRYRIKWYASIMFQNILTCSKITGVDMDGTVGA